MAQLCFSVRVRTSEISHLAKNPWDLNAVEHKFCQLWRANAVTVVRSVTGSHVSGKVKEVDVLFGERSSAQK